MGCGDQESRLPFNRDEGPYGLIICPSRELAKQIFEIIEHFTKVTGHMTAPFFRHFSEFG